MRWRVILGISLVANLILALMLTRSTKPADSSAPQASLGTNSSGTNNPRPAVIVRRQFFSWQQLESQDYPTYIKNLREIGCPEQTIRDIIIADVTQMLREKYLGAPQRLKANPKWWTNHPEAGAEAETAQAAEKMWTERAAILAELLGPDWAVRNRNVAPTTNTNAYQTLILATLEVNPVLQGLTVEKKQQVAAILNSTAVDPNMQLAADAGPDILTAPEKERWTRLAEILTVEQLEAAKLHFSAQAEALRNELDALPGFETQPEEFRKIFRNTEAIETQLAALAGRDDEPAQKQRATLNALRDAAIRSALSPERYEMYVRLSDPAYLAAIEALGDGKISPEAVRLLYAINRERDAEQERIENDPTLTDTQREIELKKLELEQMKATALARGEELLEEPGQKEKPKPEPMKVHSALPGESLDRLARIYGVPPDALKAANPGVDFSKLAAGTPVNVPLKLMYPLPPPATAQ